MCSLLAFARSEKGSLTHSMAFTRGLAFFLGQLAAGADVTNARILDATGRPSNAGLLQVKTEFGFGTVWCARGNAVECSGGTVFVSTGSYL